MRVNLKEIQKAITEMEDVDLSPGSLPTLILKNQREELEKLLKGNFYPNGGVLRLLVDQMPTET